MALPDGLATVTVDVGPYLRSDGSAARGTVTFQPEAPLLHVPTGTKILDAPTVVTLDDDGVGSVVLPASDDPGSSPSLLGYWVFWQLSGVEAPQARRVLLPAAVPQVPLESLLPVATSVVAPASVPAVSSIAGLTGTLTAEQLAEVLTGLVGGDGYSDEQVRAILATDLADVAATGAYSDLTGKPILVLAAGAPVPGGTAAGTIIYRTA